MNKQIIMGVINITPNSFSDGGKYLEASNIKSFIDQLEQTNEEFWLDIGAESSAPFNQALSDEQEWQRVSQYLLPLIDQGLIPKGSTLSIDSYHIATMKKLIPILENDYKVIWNDISGNVDKEMIELLTNNPRVDYVLCHNLAPNRERANYHIEYIEEDLSISCFRSFFESRIQKLKDHGIEMDRVILDPCFGFSKTADQNYMLLQRSDDFIDLHKRWLLGVSKKSFLQALSEGETKEEKRENSEYLHGVILSKWLKSYSNREVIYRVHDPKVFVRAKNAQKLI